MAPTSDRIPYWSRVVEIQDRLAEGLFVPDGDLSFLKKTMEGGDRLSNFADANFDA